MSEAKADDHFSSQAFVVNELLNENLAGTKDNTWYLDTELGRISVFTYSNSFEHRRDVETGFRDLQGAFWLASGDFDIRHQVDENFTVGDAIQLIKDRANTCVPIS